MSARRARRHPPRWFHRSPRELPNYTDGDGYRFRLVIDDPRFPRRDLARVVAVLAAFVPLGVVCDLVIVALAWVVVFTAVGR